MSLILYSYHRSSASYRVRIALNLKGMDYDTRPVHLLNGGGEHLYPEFREVNPQCLVPALKIDGALLTQSGAIIEYLEQSRQYPRLLPVAAVDRCQVRALAQLIACEIHPLNNLRVRNYLGSAGFSEKQTTNWARHWIEQGFQAFEELLARHQTDRRFCFGNAPGLADIYLIPQVYNACRVDVNVEDFPRLSAVNAYCCGLTEFSAAAPENQPEYSV